MYGGANRSSDVHRETLDYAAPNRYFRPIPRSSCRPNASEPSSDDEEKAGQANGLYLSMQSRVVELRQSPRIDPNCEIPPIMRGDSVAPRRPASSITEGGEFMRNTSRHIPNIKIGPCLLHNAVLSIGVSGPDGNHYCATHMGQAVGPNSEPPRVNFESDAEKPTAPACGVGNIPDAASKAFPPSYVRGRREG